MTSTQTPTGPTAADRFRTEWRDDAPPPDVVAFLGEFPELANRDLTDVLLIDQRMRWQRDEGYIAEKYFALFPAIADDPELRLDLLYGELVSRELRYSPEALHDLGKRFPDLSDDLLRQLEVARWLTSAADIGTPGPTRPAETCDQAKDLPADGVLLSLDQAPPRTSRNRPWLSRGVLAVGSLAALILIALFIGIQAQRWSTPDKPTVADATPAPPLDNPPHPIEVAWRLDVYRGGDPERRQRLTSTPGPILSGDAFRLKAELSRPAFAAAVLIDTAGRVTLLESGVSNREPAQSLSIPPDPDLAISVTGSEGTMLCVLVVSDKSIADVNELNDRLALEQPLPPLGIDRILINGVPLTKGQMSTEPMADGGVTPADLLEKLGPQFASRSPGPETPLADRRLGEALAVWYRRLPKTEWQVHYLAVPLRN